MSCCRKRLISRLFLPSCIWFSSSLYSSSGSSLLSFPAFQLPLLRSPALPSFSSCSLRCVRRCSLRMSVPCEVHMLLSVRKWQPHCWECHRAKWAQRCSRLDGRQTQLGDSSHRRQCRLERRETCHSSSWSSSQDTSHTLRTKSSRHSCRCNVPLCRCVMMSLTHLIASLFELFARSEFEFECDGKSSLSYNIILH
jgi:hypothetical protein